MIPIDPIIVAGKLQYITFPRQHRRMADGMVPTDGAGTGGARALRPRRAGALLHQARDCGSDATTTTAPRGLGDCAHTAAGPAAGTQLDSTLLGPSPYNCWYWAMTANDRAASVVAAAS